MNVGKVEALINGLPKDSALARAVAPETEGSDWGNTEELLATLAELVDVGNRQFVAANTKKGARKPKPIKIRRPWDPTERRRATAEETQELLGPGAAVVRTGGGE